MSHALATVILRLGIGPHDVGNPEADDDVGDALVFEPLDAVEGAAQN